MTQVTMEKDSAFDTGLDNENEPAPQTDTPEPGEAVEEVRSLKSQSKKALDKLVNELELEGWEIDELGKKEKFGKEGDIKQHYNAKMKRTVRVEI
jgi:hypothetical protein